MSKNALIEASIAYEASPEDLHNVEAWAYRETVPMPDIAPSGAFWPGCPTRWWRFTMLLKQWKERAFGNADLAERLKRSRTLWYRHPWMRTGETWWRPYRDPLAEVIETIDPVNGGFHRMGVTLNPEFDWAFDLEGYREGVAARQPRAFLWWKIGR